VSFLEQVWQVVNFGLRGNFTEHELDRNWFCILRDAGRRYLRSYLAVAVILTFIDLMNCLIVCIIFLSHLVIVIVLLLTIIALVRSVGGDVFVVDLHSGFYPIVDRRGILEHT
jgi:hypothetical protein